MCRGLGWFTYLGGVRQLDLAQPTCARQSVSSHCRTTIRRTLVLRRLVQQAGLGVELAVDSLDGTRDGCVLHMA